MKKYEPTTRQQVLAVLADKGASKVADIRAALPKMTPNTVSVALWQLKETKEVTHNRKTGVYALTDVNKSAEPTVTEAPKVEPKPKVAPAVSEKRLHIAQRDAKYWHERSEMLMGTLTQLREQHEDALAIIRYLEGKLYIALQQGNKNGRNA